MSSAEYSCKLFKPIFAHWQTVWTQIRQLLKDDDDEFKFNDASTHEGHLRQNGELPWFCSETMLLKEQSDLGPHCLQN